MEAWLAGQEARGEGHGRHEARSRREGCESGLTARTIFSYLWGGGREQVDAAHRFGAGAAVEWRESHGHRYV